MGKRPAHSDALKTPLPDAFADHYVICVRDIPWVAERRSRSEDDDSGSQNGPSKNDLDNLKQLTTLQPRAGKWPRPAWYGR